MKTFAIVGAGRAGSAAAMELRKSGFDGRIVLIGEEQLAPYERPPLSKSLLQDASRDAPPQLHAPAVYERERIELWTGRRVVQLDAPARSLVLDDGEALAYDEVLLATGGQARRPTFPGGEHALMLRSWADALALRTRLQQPGRLVVVGAGVIGLEVAATARQMGWQVTVLEYAQRVMARVVPQDIGEFIVGVHAAAGVEITTGAEVRAIERTAQGHLLVVASGGAHEADLVVAGIGMQPAVALAEQANAQIDGGVLVDEFGRTNVAHLYAAGDVSAFWHPRMQRHVRLESWQHAAQHAQAVARNMLGQGCAYDGLPWSWSDQYELNMQFLGQPLDGEVSVLRGDPAERKFVALHLQGRRVVGATMVNMGREMRPCRALIESGVEVDAARLADPAEQLRTMAAALVPALSPA